jgi:two-component system chemotaxis response regulator CheY
MTAEDRYDVLRDVLHELETLVLDYEQDPLTSHASGETLLRITTLIHGLKGKLKHVNRPGSALLLQGLETLVTCFRKRAEPLTREAIDTLLGAFDVITEGFIDPQETRHRIDAVADRVIALIDDQHLTATSGKLRPFPFELTPTETTRLLLAEEHGERPFIIEKVLSQRLDLSDYNNLPVYETLRSLGRVLAIRPTFEELNRSRPDSILKIVATTQHPDEQVRRVLNEPYDYCEWPIPTERRPSFVNNELPVKPPQLTSHWVDERPRRILIVEDEFISRSLLLALLGNYGVCDVAVDGHEAVAAMTQAIRDQYPYSLVCLDIMMPDMDGHQALTGLRSAENAAAISNEKRAKVVMTTALSDYDNFHRAYQSSCDSYIVKPISKSVLTRQLRRIGILPIVARQLERTERELSSIY